MQREIENDFEVSTIPPELAAKIEKAAPAFTPTATLKSGRVFAYHEMLPGCVGFIATTGESVLYGEHWNLLNQHGRIATSSCAVAAPQGEA